HRLCSIAGGEHEERAPEGGGQKYVARDHLVFLHKRAGRRPRFGPRSPGSFQGLGGERVRARRRPTLHG
ncbi:MAG: hypothetical protein WAN39_04770, partial [Candidatus Cybelea sp.]